MACPLHSRSALVVGTVLACFMTACDSVIASTACEAAYAAGDYDGAASAARAGADEDETSRSICRARSLLRLGLPDEAVAPLQRALSAVSSDEDRFAAASLLGMAQMHRGYGAEAIAAYNVAIDAARALRDPNREAHALFDLALAYEGLGLAAMRAVAPQANALLMVTHTACAPAPAAAQPR